MTNNKCIEKANQKTERTNLQRIAAAAGNKLNICQASKLLSKAFNLKQFVSLPAVSHLSILYYIYIYIIYPPS